MPPISPDPIPDRHPHDETLARFLAGECDAGEQQAVSEWAAENAAYAKRLDEARHAWAAWQEPVAKGDVDAFLHRLRRARTEESQPGRAVSSPSVSANVLRHSRATNTHSSTLWRSTAVRIVALVTTAACIIFAYGVSRTHHRQGAGGNIARRYATTAGQYATVTLDDGSMAVLGPATKLNVRRDGDGPTVATTTSVEGEVMFTVGHRSAAPFIVRAGGTSVRVLGTTFTVRRYDTDHATRVAVIDGRVAVNAERQGGTARTVVLPRGALAVVDSGEIHVTPVVAIDEYIAWTKGRLIFRNTPFRDVLLALERAYGVTIHLSDSALAKAPVTWTVPTADRSLPDVLDGLTSALDADATRANGVITIVARRTPAHTPTRRDTVVHPSFGQESQYGR